MISWLREPGRGWGLRCQGLGDREKNCASDGNRGCGGMQLEREQEGQMQI